MRILLVDDSQTIIHVLTKLLNELGYSVIDKAHNCKEAEIYINSQNGPPDLIISDWNMPGGTGLDLLKYVRGNKLIANTPFILLTSDQDKSKIFQAKQFNPQCYLLKPPNKLILVEKLSLLAKTHGIQPPKGGFIEPIGGGDTTSQEFNSEKPQNESSLPTNSEEVAKILKQCVFVLTRRKTPAELLHFLGNEIFHLPPENIKLQDIQELSETVNTIIQQQLYSAFESKK